MLLLIAIHFHSNQTNAIADLVSTTLGMKVGFCQLSQSLWFSPPTFQHFNILSFVFDFAIAEYRERKHVGQNENHIHPRDFHGTSCHEPRCEGSSDAKAERRNSGIQACPLHLSAAEEQGIFKAQSSNQGEFNCCQLLLQVVMCESLE